MIPPGVAGPEIQNPVVWVVDFSEVAEPRVGLVVDHEVSRPAAVLPAVVFVAGLAAPEPAVVFVAGLEALEPAVVFAAVVSVADAAGPRVSADIAPAFDVLIPVSAVAVGVDSPGHPRFFAVPNIDHRASSSSSVEVVG